MWTTFRQSSNLLDDLIVTFCLTIHSLCSHFQPDVVKELKMSFTGAHIKSKNFSYTKRFFWYQVLKSTKLFKKVAVLDFESIWVQQETLKDIEKITWIGIYVPILISFSSNLVEEPLFLCNIIPHYLVAIFIGILKI